MVVFVKYYSLCFDAENAFLSRLLRLHIIACPVLHHVWFVHCSFIDIFIFLLTYSVRKNEQEINKIFMVVIYKQIQHYKRLIFDI